MGNLDEMDTHLTGWFYWLTPRNSSTWYHKLLQKIEGGKTVISNDNSIRLMPELDKVEKKSYSNFIHELRWWNSKWKIG